MRIKLIAPANAPGGTASSGETFKILRTGLPLLAALTPEGHDVELVDESFAPDDGRPADLVGITVMTELASRAYEIGDRYREAGARVVMGGIHASVCIEEALRHADAVVVGEGEESWPRVVRDAERGSLEQVYRAERPFPVRALPELRRDLYPQPDQSGYTPDATGIEATRGCPFDCEFCSIASVLGRSHRVRPVAHVVRELASIESSFVFFVDDSLALQRDRAKELFRAMIPLRKRWVGQGGVALAQDPELLELMRLSGCLGLLIGFESVQSESQARMSKLDRLEIGSGEAMARFHDAGLAILGAFVFGFDGDDRHVFERTYDFINRHHIDILQLRMLTPFPGTRLHTRLKQEGRLYCDDWWLKGHTTDTLLFRPDGMEPEELVEGVTRLLRSTYSYASIARRFFGVSPRKRRLTGCRVVAGINLAMRHRYAHSTEVPQPFVGAPGPAAVG